MNVVSLFQEQARQHPDAEALVEGRSARRRALSFRDLDDRGGAGAAFLASLGVGRGTRVLVLVPLSVRLYEIVAAILRLGAVVTLVDPGAGRRALNRCVALARPDVLVGTPKAHLLRVLSRSVRQIPTRVVVDGWVPGAARWDMSGETEPVAGVDDGAPALMTFTSGSTGQPKGTVRTHGLLRAQHAALDAALGLAPGQRDLTTLPVFVLANLGSGVTSLLPDADLRRPGAVDPRPLIEQIEAERPTRTVASPAFVERLVASAPPSSLASLRAVAVGGAPVFPDTLARFARAMPHAAIRVVYGSTEAEPISHTTAADLSAADFNSVREGGGLPVGRPVPEADVRIVRDQWGTPLGPMDSASWDALALPQGEAGEIVVAGTHVLPGYLDGVGDEETKVRVGGRVWHRTGDAGRFDAEGRLWLLGRCAAAVRDELGVLYPFTVEAAARALDGVANAALVPGRRLLAVEGTADPQSVAESLAWAHLGVIRIGRIPLDRRHNAKVDYPALAALAKGRGADAGP